MNHRFIKLIVFIACSLVSTSAHGQHKGVFVKTGEVKVIAPIDVNIVKKAIALVNNVYRSEEFQTEIEKYNFVCSNKPDLCDSSGVINGGTVYRDIMQYDTIVINLTVKNIGIRFWRRYISKTQGATAPTGNSIVTYTWWLDNNNMKDLIIQYAAHIGHEIFHTKYYKYIHDPSAGSRGFVNDKDVTYKIDDIIEALIIKNYHQWGGG